MKNKLLVSRVDPQDTVLFRIDQALFAAAISHIQPKVCLLGAGKWHALLAELETEKKFQEHPIPLIAAFTPRLTINGVPVMLGNEPGIVVT